MDEIKEVFSDIRETVGDKWFFIFIGVAVIFGLYNLVKGSGESSDGLTPVTSISSYPDAVTNANVIIDTLQDSIQYSEDRVNDNINATYKDLSEQIGTNFEATNDFINKGFESQGKLLEENFDELHGTIENNFNEVTQAMDKNFSAINSSMGQMKNEISKNSANIGSLTNKVGNLSSTVGGLQSSVGGLQSTVGRLQSSVGGLQSSVSSLANKVNQPVYVPAPEPKKSSGSSGSSKKDDTLTYKTQSGLNTSTSIVDALKATGADSSFSARAELYYKNGGTGTYTGSASQNTQMLNKLKSGKLKG